MLGVILLTGYLGGAVATHMHVGAGWFPIVFPVIFGVLIWGGLYLRDERLRAHSTTPLAYAALAARKSHGAFGSWRREDE